MMKTKLLKKVRKRFEILYYPEQSYSHILDKYQTDTLVFVDNDERYGGYEMSNLKKDSIEYNQAIDIMKKQIISTIKKDYKKYSKHYKNNIKVEKIWYGK